MTSSDQSRRADASPSTRAAAPVVRRVAVFGGGTGGLSAALEPAERGFAVDIDERNELGGKARGFYLEGTGSDGGADLPGEIGPHFPFTIFDIINPATPHHTTVARRLHHRTEKELTRA